MPWVIFAVGSAFLVIAVSLLARASLLERSRPTWLEALGFGLVVMTLAIVVAQLEAASRQIGESQHVAAATATLDFIDRAMDECVELNGEHRDWTVFPATSEREEETGWQRMWRLKGDMIDHLREGSWGLVDASYQGVREAMCHQLSSYAPKYAVHPDLLDDPTGA